MKEKNLNELEIRGVHGSNFPLKNFNGNFGNVNIEVYFRDIENILITKILEADYIFGCVAWLTSDKILEALAMRDTFIVIQKEDFLRPDLGKKNKPEYKNRIRYLYNSLSCRFSSHSFNNKALKILGGCYGMEFDQPVRCVGMFDKSKRTLPRMHNKFIIFCKSDEYDSVEPYSVWTGSFNFTINASYSFENAIYINSRSVANAFFEEFGQIAALSEPLDWETEWVNPEWEEANT